MHWYVYLASFFAGILLANAIPHFVQGVSGNKFPSPFARPPGRGLSSPVVNVLWALFNAVIGYFLFQLGNVSSTNLLSLVVFAVGVAIMSVFSSIAFEKKEKA